MNILDAIRSAVAPEPEAEPVEPMPQREKVISRFFRLYGIEQRETLDETLRSLAAEAMQRVRSGLPPGIVTFAGPTRIPTPKQYQYPLLAAFDVRRETAERELADAEARAHAARDDVYAGGWATEDALGKAQAAADRLREHVREMHAIAPVGEFLAFFLSLREEHARLAMLEPEAHFEPLTVREIVRPDNATRNPFREPDEFDRLQAMERVRTSRLNSLLHPGSTEYSRSAAEVARLESRIRQWYREHSSLAEMIDEDRGIA